MLEQVLVEIAGVGFDLDRVLGEESAGEDTKDRVAVLGRDGIGRRPVHACCNEPLEVLELDLRAPARPSLARQAASLVASDGVLVDEPFPEAEIAVLACPRLDAPGLGAATTALAVGGLRPGLAGCGGVVSRCHEPQPYAGSEPGPIGGSGLESSRRRVLLTFACCGGLTSGSGSI